MKEKTEILPDFGGNQNTTHDFNRKSNFSWDAWLPESGDDRSEEE